MSELTKWFCGAGLVISCVIFLALWSSARLAKHTDEEMERKRRRKK